MPVPSVITDLSATAASNSPAGGDAVFPDLDNYLRAHAGLIRYGDTKASNITSGTTIDLGAAVGRIVDVTGTTPITSFGTVAAGVWRIVRFTGALTLTHNATSLILPGAANITTAAGDCAIAVSLSSGNWLVTHYQRAVVQAAFRATAGSAQTSGTTVTYTSEAFDVGSALTAGTGVFVAPAAGLYHFSGSWRFLNDGGSAYLFTPQISVNGSAIAAVSVAVPGGSSTDGTSLSATAQLAAGDQVAAIMANAFTANTSLVVGYFSGHLVR